MSEGLISKLPKKAEIDRVAAFEAMLEKCSGFFSGIRGFVYRDGPFRDLGEFGDPDMVHDNFAIIDMQERGNDRWWDYAQSGGTVLTYYCDKYGATRIWVQLRELMAWRPHWTQADLDAVWNFVTPLMVDGRVTEFNIEDSSGHRRTGPIEDLPEQVDSLWEYRKLDRVAAFEAMLPKLGMFEGLRGFLYLDGSWDDLSSRNVGFHAAFARHRLLDDHGFWDYLKAHPIPSTGGYSDPGYIIAILGRVVNGSHSKPGDAEWAEDMLKTTGMTKDEVARILEFTPMDYCWKYHAIRVWGEGTTVTIESPVWDQRHLDAVWDLVIQNAETEGWKNWIIEGPGGHESGNMGELPEKIEDLFPRQRAAAFEAMLIKNAARLIIGFLYPDGKFEELGPWPLNSHNTAAWYLLLDKLGVWDWMRNDPEVKKEAHGDLNPSTLRDLALTSLGSWKGRLMGATGVSQEMLTQDYIADYALRDWCERSGAIRIVALYHQLICETTTWTQKQLDAVWDFVQEYNIDLSHGVTFGITRAGGFSQIAELPELPEKIEDLYGMRAAGFKGELEKLGFYSGMRGWLNLDGTFDSLEARHKGMHGDYAKERIMQDAGVLEWIKNNPMPLQASSTLGIAETLGMIWNNRNNRPGWSDYLEKMERETGLDRRFPAVMYGGGVEDLYCQIYNCIRIWSMNKELIAQAPHWTQKHLDVLRKFVLTNIEAEEWELYVIESWDGDARGEIWDLPASVGDLFKKEIAEAVWARNRTAQFEAMLEKFGMFEGMRGWLYPNGSFEPLSSRGVTFHEAFAMHHFLQDAGFMDWIKDNPFPTKIIHGDKEENLLWSLEASLLGRPENEEWENKLYRETKVTPELLDLLYSGKAQHEYAKQFKAIRIWGSQETLIAETWIWTQAALDNLTRFILTYIDQEHWKKCHITEYSTEKDVLGDIWEIPTQVEDLFKEDMVEAARNRAAGLDVCIKRGRMVAQSPEWNQEQLDSLWVFAMDHIGNIKTFSINSSTANVRGNIWELPKRVEVVRS